MAYHRYLRNTFSKITRTIIWSYETLSQEMHKTTLIIFIIVIVIILGALFIANQQHTENASFANKSSAPPNQKTQEQTNALFNENKPAPELTGITAWLNTNSPLTISELRGKVVLIDLWTNQCINCIRTL